MLFRKLILDYQKSCPSGGAGKKQYSKARALEILSQETLSDEGSRFAKFLTMTGSTVPRE